jgi:hypothetical protein
LDPVILEIQEEFYEKLGIGGMHFDEWMQMNNGGVGA